MDAAKTGLCLGVYALKCKASRTGGVSSTGSNSEIFAVQTEARCSSHLLTR